MKCKHENADHHQHLNNGLVVAEWLQCLDCEALLVVRPISGGPPRAKNYARPKVRR